MAGLSVVTLRLDLPRFPDRWDRGPGDTLQCHLAFAAVQDFEMTGWRPPATADVVLTPFHDHRGTQALPHCPRDHVNTFYEHF